MKSLGNKTGLIFDLFFCVIFMPLLLLLGPAHSWWEQWRLFFFIASLYLYGCYFVTRYLRLPKLFLSKKYGKISLICLALVGCTYLLTLYPLPKVDFVTPLMSEYQTRMRDYNVSISIWFMLSLILCYSLTVSFVKELYERLLLQNIAENQRNKAKLDVFKAQISPHFLFNTLNSLYSLVIGTSPKAEEAIAKFAELLKYTYVTIENEFVTIGEEISYIQNYIDLQEIRLDHHTKIHWEHQVDDPQALIPPMIFLTFVENAFKYGASTSQECELHIRIGLQEGKLLFETRNRVLKHANEFRKEMPVGVENCKARLAGLFPGRHLLHTEEADGIFKVTLNIDLNGHG